MSELLDEVLEHVDMFDILAYYRIYEGTRMEHQVHCPVHEEVRPSARVYEDGLLQCFACQVQYNPISTIMHTEDLTFRAALRWLEIKYDFEIPYELLKPKSQQSAAKKVVETDVYRERIQKYLGKIPLQAYLALWKEYDNEIIDDFTFSEIFRIFNLSV